MNAKQTKKDIIAMEIGDSVNVNITAEKDFKYLHIIMSSIRKANGYFLKCDRNGDTATVRRLEGKENMQTILDGMKQGEVMHFDKSKYDTLRTYSGKHGVKVQTVVEVVKL